jgi:hypothetical protein
MVINTFNKNELILREVLIEINQELELNLSNLFIPFSKFFKKETPLDIYTGKEKIPFHEKDSEFKNILIQEFL